MNGALGQPAGPSAALALAAAAAAEIVAVAARRDFLRSDFIESGPTTTLAGTTDVVPNLGSVTGASLVVTVDGSVTPIVMLIAGKRYAISTAKTVTVTNTQTSFLYYDSDTDTIGASALAPRFSYTAPTNASDKHWFDMSTGLMKVGDGASAWTAKNRIFLGVCRADSGVIATSNIGWQPFSLTVATRRSMFGDGSDGTLSVANAATSTIDAFKQYEWYECLGTGKIVNTINAGAQSPVLFSQFGRGFFGTSGLDLNGLGRNGGNGTTGVGGAAAGNANGGGGGGGGGGTSAGGAGGPIGLGQFGRTVTQASGTAGTAGNNGGNAIGIVPAADPSGDNGHIGAGNGGGGGGGDGGVAGSNGGPGGGTALTKEPMTIIGASAVIRANGSNGTDSTGNNRGAGGGGGGGIIDDTVGAEYDYTGGGTKTATAGTGGSKLSFTGCGNGGTGDNGAYRKRRMIA